MCQVPHINLLWILEKIHSIIERCYVYNAVFFFKGVLRYKGPYSRMGTNDEAISNNLGSRFGLNLYNFLRVCLAFDVNSKSKKGKKQTII